MAELVFDIETIPDIEHGRKMYGLEELSDADAAEAMFALRREKTQSDFLAHPSHRIVAISLVLAQGKQLRVWSLGELQSTEKELITRFFAGIDKYTPTLISWNGSGFDLPVLHYRALRHGVAAPTYWENGDNLQNFRYNNYLSRFHSRHLDLMDVLAAYQNRAVAPLDEIASMLGFPGKMGMSGARVWEQYQAGNLQSIRDYCETDVLNTYGVYLRFELMRGNLSLMDYQQRLQGLVDYLHQETERPHLQEFARHIEKEAFL
ncbi:MAG: 3'-5' exonuclease [Legionellaceae bacterium]|nr:3'-5' exonuclease [Legionellaceae bacterium]